MSNLTSHFEKLNHVIDQFEQSLNAKLEKSTDFSEESSRLKDKNKQLSDQVGHMIGKVERLIANMES